MAGGLVPLRIAVAAAIIGTPGFVSPAAFRTTLRLIGEALGGVEFLLAGGEREVRLAVYTIDCLVCKTHLDDPPLLNI